MKLKIYYGNTGTGKSYGIMQQIKEKTLAGEKCLAIVPGQFTFEYEKHLYDYLGARLYNSGSVEVLSLERVKGRILERVPPELEAADIYVKISALTAAIKAAAAEGLLCYGSRAGAPGFTETVMKMISELSRSSVTPEKLAELAERAKGKSFGDKLSDISAIFTEYRRRLNAFGLRDTDEDTALAALSAEKSGFFGGKYIYIDEFKSFTGDQYALIREMLICGKELTVALTAPAENMRNAFASVCNTMRILSDKNFCGYAFDLEKTRFEGAKRSSSPALTAMAERLFEPGRLSENKLPGDDITIVTADSLHRECLYVCAEIRRLVSEGARFRDMTILSREMNNDVNILSHYLDKYRIPYYSDKKVPAMGTVYFRALALAMELSIANDTRTVLSYAKTGLAGLDAESVRSLENYAYMWGIEGSTWSLEFPDKDMDELKNRLLSPLKFLKSSALKTGSDRAAAFLSLFDDLEKRMPADDTEDPDALKMQSINSQAADKIREILTALRDHCTEELSASEFADIFLLCASKVQISTVPNSLDAVSVQASQLARLSDPEYVFIIHANDGVFPLATGQDTTFSDTERIFFRDNDCELYSDLKMMLSEEKFGAYKVMCAPSKKLYMSFSTGGGGKCSPYITRLRKLLDVREINTDSLDPAELCRTPGSAYTVYASQQSRPEVAAAIRDILEEDPGFAEKFSYLDSVQTGYAPRHRLNAPKTPEMLFGKALGLSATRLEEYSKCPFRFFIHYGLGVRKPEQKKLSAIYWGNAVHRCMEVFFSEYSKEDLIGLSSDTIAQRVSQIVDEHLQRELSGGFAQSPDLPVFTDRLKGSTLRCLKRMQDEMRDTDFRVKWTEKELGGRNSALNVVSGAHSVYFSGKTDRVDVLEDRENSRYYVRIIDYKTGRKDFKKDQLANGINLQMFLYLYELTGKGGDLEGYKPAGVLYCPVVAPDPVKGRDITPEEILKGQNSDLRMKGLVLDDPAIVQAMEKISPKQRGRFIPVNLKADGSFDARSYVTDEEGFERISRLAVETLKNMCSSIYNGEVPASPLDENMGSGNQCEYCDYQNCCSNFSFDEIKREWRDESELDC